MSVSSGSIGATERVAIDTSCPRSFYRAGLLPGLIAYVRGGVATAAVRRELELQGQSRPVFAQTLSRTRWPDDIGYRLSPAEQAEALRIQREWIEEDVRNNPGIKPGSDAHLGEIETVLAAVSASVTAVLMDDRRGRYLASARGLLAKSTGGLAIEMTHFSLLTGDEGFAVYEVAYGAQSRSEFDRLVAEYRA